ncbi:MAG: hypothetical protein EZS28_002836 [Streblomastix strix]|uniref:Uncharacterized protein n=1 Tax=Streblomastix strix TaxID=222440 RepID=A0A5J4X3T2_9EUKA|nr:MAG: hypothetical protein EZS28_002836 [Streblomastix strix]
MNQSSSSSSSTQGQGPSASSNQIISGVRSRRVYEDIYKKGSNEYLPYNVKNQARYMGFIRGQPKTKLPRQNITFENITARVGNGRIGEKRRAQQRALADQVGSVLIYIVGRLAKDIKRVKTLVNEQSAQNWINDKARVDHNHGFWYDETIRPLIPAAVAKQLFNKAAQIVLKSMRHSVYENHGRTNQALRRKQQLSFLRLAPYLWKKYFIGWIATLKANEQTNYAFTQANYFQILFQEKQLSELAGLYNQIKDQTAKIETLIEDGADLGFVLNFTPPILDYQQAIRIIQLSKPPKTAMQNGEPGDNELNELAAIQQSLDLEKQEQQF